MDRHTLHILQLKAGDLQLEIAPEVGGSISAFFSQGPQGRIDWLRPASDEALVQRNPLGMSSFPLVPFCNRIRNGRASFEGREIRFPPNHPAEDSPHPLHGIGWLRPWQVQHVSATSAGLALDVPASTAWPWHFSSTQEVLLAPDRADVTITITNLDDVAMPAGIGHHPYFPHTPGTRVTSPCQAMWTADAQVMPLALEPTDAVRRLCEGVQLDELDLDNNFTGWQRRCTIEWEGGARRLVMQADPPLDYFVLYCPTGFPHFCAEPVSQCTDWLNLMPAFGRDAVGGSRLEPGETLHAHFTLALQWL